MKIFIIAQMQKVFAFFFLFAFIDANLNDGIVSQSIVNNGNEPIVSIVSADKAYYLEKYNKKVDIEANTASAAVESEHLALNSQIKNGARTSKERQRFVLPVVKLTTSSPEF